MAYIKNKMLYVLNDNKEYIPFRTVKDEIFLTDDLVSSEIFNFQNGYFRAVLSPLSLKIVKIFILNKDETIHKDISEYISNDWSFSMNYENGSIRSGNISVINSDKTWMPNPINGSIWKATKFKIYIGIYYNDIIYWNDFGIMVAGNPSVDDEKQMISFPLYDKFSLLNGTVGGKRSSSFKIPAGTTVRDAISLCLTENKGNNEVYDDKPILFPAKYLSQKTPYTITKDPNTAIGEIILELSKMINCDTYYNSNGNLTLSEGIVTNDDLQSQPILWEYKDGQYSPPTYDIDFDKLINEIVVAGAIENGKQYKAAIVNKSPSSQMNIYMTEPNPLYIEDSNIIGDKNCETRAKYEMIRQGRMGVQLKFRSIFIPHLKCNQLILFSDEFSDFFNEQFVVNSISIDSSSGMSLVVSSVNEVIF